MSPPVAQKWGFKAPSGEPGTLLRECPALLQIEPKGLLAAARLIRLLSLVLFLDHLGKGLALHPS